MARKVFVPSDDDAARVAKSKRLAEIVESARLQERDRRHQDPEWTVSRWTSPREILRAFAFGVLQSDQWHREYRVPYGFEEVVNHLARALQETYADAELIPVSLVDVERIISESLRHCVTWRAWGGDPEAVIVITPTTPQIAADPVPLDLEAVLVNAIVLIRDIRRQEDARDRAVKDGGGP